jgi:peptide/nickel transport system substrate-binding protein
MRTCDSATVRTAALAAIAAAALLLTGCGSGGTSAGTGTARPERGGTVHLAQIADVITLDPTQALDNESIRVLSQIVEPLYKTDPQGKTAPWLVASARRSPDGRTSTFRLRPGIRFSNGKPLTADDVVFSLDAARKSANWGFLLTSVAGVKATSPSTFAITTKKRVAPLFANLSLFAAGIVPKNYGGMSEKQFAQHPIGTGPYKLGRWVRGQSLTLDRNPRYWQPGKPLLDHIAISAIPDDNSRVSQLQGGQLDVVAAPPWSRLPALSGNPQLHVGQYALARTDYLIANEQKPLFRDPRVREALSLALDRGAIVKAALNGYGQVAGSWLAPSLLYHARDVKPPAHDVAKAKALLAQALHGAPARFTLTFPAGDAYFGTAAQIVQQDLRQAGFDVTLQPLDQSAVLADEQGGKFDAALIYVTSDIADPSELVGLYVSLQGFFDHGDTAPVAKLQPQADAASDPVTRATLYNRIQHLIDRDHGLIPMDYQPYVWGMSRKVAGFAVNPTGIYWLADAGLAR